MALMERFRQSVNVQRGDDDALIRFLREAEAFMPDDMRAEQNRAPLTEEQRRIAGALVNDQRPFYGIEPGDDRFGQGRAEPEGPGPLPATPAMLGGLISGPATDPASFMQQNDHAQLQQQIAAMLEGKSPDERSAFLRALEQVAGPLAPSSAMDRP